MAWTIEFTESARREIRKLDRTTARQVRAFLNDRVLASGDPRSFGKALGGALSGLWTYRVGDYRIISEVQDNVLTVLVVRVGHRRNVYRRL
ncbi:MAG: type II toxin-antitoxin system RelE/ParE family toxin [Chloroflexi bacterium]|nr:type II toxin-antitoxin system RelE/ParE family toxin [Chloroflexota bacterium]